MDLSRLTEIVRNIETKKQVSDDVRGELGNIYQDAEEIGFNRSALKMAVKLKNMENAKRNDYLSSLQAYCDHLEIWRNGDLFGDPPGVPQPPSPARAEASLGETSVPYLAGQMAAQAGYEASRNPHPAGSEDNEAWRRGWLKAWDDGRQRAEEGPGLGEIEVVETGSAHVEAPKRAGPPTRRRGRPSKNANGRQPGEAAP